MSNHETLQVLIDSIRSTVNETYHDELRAALEQIASRLEQHIVEEQDAERHRQTAMGQTDAM